MPSSIRRELALLVTGDAASANRAIKSVDKNLGKLQTTGAKAGKAMSRNLERGVIAGGIAIAAAGAFVVNQAVEWESAVAGVAKTIDGDVTKIADGIIDMSKKVPLAAVELAALAEQAGALGIKKDDILEFTEVAATLGVTTNVAAIDAATALGGLSNVLGLTQQDYERFGSALVDLGNKGASTEAEILEITTRAGAAAALLDVGTDATLGWAAAFANLRMQPELAGTAMQMFLTKSLNLVAAGKGGLENMAKIAGTSAKQFKKSFDKDASGALESFVRGLAKLPKDKRLKAIQGLFGKTSGLNRALLGLAESYDRNLAPSIDTATEAWDANNAMSVEAEKRYATTASKLQILDNNVKAAAITIGTELLPVLADLSTDAVAWIDEHQSDIKTFSQDLGKGVREAVEWLKKLDWDAIGKGLQIAAGFAGQLIQAFTDAPPWLQGFLITGFLANKFTGGAVMDIAGMLLGSVVKGVLGMTAAVVHLTAGTVVGGGPGIPGAGGKGGGGGMGLLAGLGALGFVAAIELAIADAVGPAFREALGIEGVNPAQGKKVNVGPIEVILGRSDAAHFREIARQQESTKQKTEKVTAQLKYFEADSRTEAARLRQILATNEGRSERVGTQNAQMQAQQARIAASRTTQAIKDKDLSVATSVINQNNVKISSRDVVSTTTKTTVRSGGGGAQRHN